MGILGVAIAAFEHFSSQRNAAASAGPGVSPTPPPPPPAAGPPPPPAPTSAASAGVSPVTLLASEAELLIQAMVAAAHADGEIDQKELKAIHQRMAEAGLSEEEQAELERRMADPPSLQDILAAVDNPRLGVQVYAVSLAAIEVDTPAEHEYLKQLREGLNLPPSVVARLHDEFDLEEQ